MERPIKFASVAPLNSGLVYQVRMVCGWCLILLGIAGCILPIIPGLPLLALGIALVGRRHPTIRWWSVNLRRTPRNWARSRQPWLRSLGRRLVETERTTLRQLRSITQRPSYG